MSLYVLLCFVTVAVVLLFSGNTKIAVELGIAFVFCGMGAFIYFGWNFSLFIGALVFAATSPFLALYYFRMRK